MIPSEGKRWKCHSKVDFSERDTTGLPVGLSDGTSAGAHNLVMTLFIVTSSSVTAVCAYADPFKLLPVCKAIIV